MTTPGPAKAASDTHAEYIAFEEFRAGLLHGRFHVVVDPKLAYPFVARRLYALQVGVALAGAGIACALSGYRVTGLLLVAAAALLRFSLRRQAPQVLLQLVTRMPQLYEAATADGVMEVRRAGS
jgi:hypothetical protein